MNNTFCKGLAKPFAQPAAILPSHVEEDADSRFHFPGVFGSNPIAIVHRNDV